MRPKVTGQTLSFNEVDAPSDAVQKKDSTVNFGEKTYAMKDGFVLPPHGHRFEIPLQCRNVGNARD